MTRKDMTFILGSRCKDGVVLVADRRITSSDGSYSGLGDKLFHNVDLTVWGASGNLDYFESFKERVKVAMQDRGRVPAHHFILLVEDVHAALLKNYGTAVVRDFAVLIASRIGAKSQLNFVGVWGGHRPVNTYETIGSGTPYGAAFLKTLWKSSMGMKDVAELGYFVIKLIENKELDASVGVERGHPQVWFLPDNPQTPDSTYGNEVTIRAANEIELDGMAESVKRKLDLFDSGFETFLNRS